MKSIVDFFKKEKVALAFMAVKVVVMLLLLYLYLMWADLSTAPEFIYNQF